MRSRLSLVVGNVLAWALVASAKADEAVNDTGQLEFTASTIEVNKVPGREEYGGISVTVSITIKNSGQQPVRIAVSRPDPTISFKGLSFVPNWPTNMTGVSVCQGATVRECQLQDDSFTLLRPGRRAVLNISSTRDIGRTEIGSVSTGRFNGSIYVKGLNEGKAWMESLSLDEISVKSYTP